MTLRVHAVTHGSRANGPGSRAVLHVQGCTIGCKGCFSTHTWDPAAGRETAVGAVLSSLVAGDPDGITISGGEPLQQAAGLLELLQKLHVYSRGLRWVKLPKGVILYTGTTDKMRAEIPQWPEIRGLCDLVVAGPFVQALSLHPVRELRSSSNQELLYNPKGVLKPSDFNTVPSVEFKIGQGGDITICGFPERAVREEFPTL